MKTLNKLSLAFIVSVLLVPALPSQIVLAGEEERAPPEARTAGTLGPQVMRAISEIQELMSPEEGGEPDYARAKEELDQLRERRWERMNDFEKSTTLAFYTNYYLGLEDYPGALLIFEEMLTIEDLRLDQRLRTLKTLGQLYMAEERWQESIESYIRWRELSVEEDPTVYKGLSYGYYQSEDYPSALPYWLDYMNLSLQLGEELGRDDYQYLSGVYFSMEDYQSLLDLTKTMIILFDEPSDWVNLNAVYASLDNDDRRIQALNMAYLMGHIDDEQYYLNLGQSLAGREIPLTGAKIIEEGLELGIIEAELDNLQTNTQMHMIASTYADGLEVAQRVAELDPTGDGWDTVGYFHYMLYNYDDAAEAFQTAIDKGDLSDRSATLLWLSRSLYELDDFEGARAAARQAADSGDSDSSRNAASNYITLIDSTEQRYNIIEQRKAEAIDFYESYPSLID